MLSTSSLNDGTFRDLRDYIYDVSGIYITDTKKYLVENRLGRILQEKKLKSYEDYFKHIRGTSNGAELNRLLDAVTTNETYFFRENQQLEVLMKTIVPKIIAQHKNSKKLKIWTAACSTGEEPYTLAMMLMENKLPPGQFEINATDISEQVLASAKQAVYNSYSVRNVPESYMKKYFSSDGKTFALNSTVKSSVRFSNTNLIDEKKMRTFKGQDIILCRNVLIYFDTKAKQKAVSALYDALNPGGYLFIGASESLHSVTRALRPNVINKVITYQKV